MITMKKSKDRKPEQQVDLEYVSAARIRAQILPSQLPGLYMIDILAEEMQLHLWLMAYPP